MGIVSVFIRKMDKDTKTKQTPVPPKAKIRFGSGGCNCGKRK